MNTLVYACHTRNIKFLALSNCKSLFAISSTDRIIVLDILSTGIVKIFEADGEFGSIDFSSDGSRLYAIDGLNIKAFDLATGSVVFCRPLKHSVMSLACSDDGTTLVVTTFSSGVIRLNSEGEFVLEFPQAVINKSDEIIRHSKSIASVGTLSLVHYDSPGDAILYSRTGEVIKHVQGNNCMGTVAAVSPDGTRILFAKKENEGYSFTVHGLDSAELGKTTLKNVTFSAGSTFSACGNLVLLADNHRAETTVWNYSDNSSEVRKWAYDRHRPLSFTAGEYRINITPGGVTTFVHDDAIIKTLHLGKDSVVDSIRSQNNTVLTLARMSKRHAIGSFSFNAEKALEDAMGCRIDSGSVHLPGALLSFEQLEDKLVQGHTTAGRFKFQLIRY